MYMSCICHVYVMYMSCICYVYTMYNIYIYIIYTSGFRLDLRNPQCEVAMI